VTATAERIEVPATALVLMIGAAGSGKSTFAARHFPAEAVVSSDQLRALIGRDESNQSVTDAVFQRLHDVLNHRLGTGLLTVVDATNTDWMRRAEVIRSSHRHQRPAIAIVFDLPLEVCLARNTSRSRTVRAGVVKRHVAEVRRDRDRLDLEGFAAIYVLASTNQAEHVIVEIKQGPVARALSS